MEPTGTRDGRIAAVASLDQPVRRLLYELLAARRDWTSRDDAASALDVARSVAAFHLDKLADSGVVEVSFERTSGRSGPGAGRPSKMYRLAAAELSASMPDRQYDLAAQLLASAVADSTATGTPVDQCLHRVAHDTGRSMGLRERQEPEADGDPEDRGGPGEGGQADPTLGPQVFAALERRGYEPCQMDDGEIALANCPFHRLAEEHRALVCGMNLDFVDGLIEGVALDSPLHARLAPAPGYCCVRLRQD